jgi:hypothetical protein
LLLQIIFYEDFPKKGTGSVKNETVQRFSGDSFAREKSILSWFHFVTIVKLNVCCKLNRVHLPLSCVRILEDLLE